MNLGRYEVVRELGKGAMGIVYLGKDPLIGRLVALKTIRATTVDDDDTREFRERFLREAQAAGILSHPSIVTVHDIGQDDATGMSYIAMEYVEGPNLKEILQQGKPMDRVEIADAIAQVAEALDYAHSKGITHRDVKPANIILCENSRVKITDFGIAKIASAVANLTSTGQFLGTPNYMAPEQIKGGAVDGRTDIFSLGIVLYEALTRRKPFGGDSLTTISYKIVHDAFLPLREVDPEIPEEFEAIVAKCLQKDPAKRYQRARELAVDLRNAVRPEGTPPIELDDTMGSEGVYRIPTLEVPFPEASGEWSPSRFARAGITGSFRRRIPAKVFIGVTALLIVVFGATALALWQSRVPVPNVDTRREATVTKQRNLREQAELLLSQGNTEGAYQKYRQLQELAPNSPAVREMLAQLDKTRILNLSIRQRQAQAQAKLEEGRKLFEKKQYAKAIPFFEEAFHLNPNDQEPVNYMRASREMLQVQNLTAGPALGGGFGQTTTAQLPPGRASTLNIVVRSQTTDGYVLVRAGNQTLAHESLWVETAGSARRKVPRDVRVTKPVPAGSVEIVVYYVVPSRNINKQSATRERFDPGVSYTMVVNLRGQNLDVRIAKV